MEQTQYKLLFRWCVIWSMEDAVWVPPVFSKNRERLIERETVRAFFDAVLRQARQKR